MLKPTIHFSFFSRAMSRAPLIWPECMLCANLTQFTKLKDIGEILMKSNNSHDGTLRLQPLQTAMHYTRLRQVLKFACIALVLVFTVNVEASNIPGGRDPSPTYFFAHHRNSGGIIFHTGHHYDPQTACSIWGPYRI